MVMPFPTAQEMSQELQHKHQVYLLTWPAHSLEVEKMFENRPYNLLYGYARRKLYCNNISK